jgi:hypothetical protein
MLEKIEQVLGIKLTAKQQFELTDYLNNVNNCNKEQIKILYLKARVLNSCYLG